MLLNLSPRPISKLLTVVLLLVSLPLYPAVAELTGGDRAAFVKNFGTACFSSSGTEILIGTFGGTLSQKDAYCNCVANVYADRLSTETINQIREIERLSLADLSREVCLEEVFSDWKPEQLEGSESRFYPADADTAKRVFGWTTDARSSLSVDANGADRSAQIIVINASASLFCWSEPLSVERQILDSSPEEPVISALWCEDLAGGYAEVFRIAEEEFVVGFSLQDGRKQWLVHEVKLAN